MGTPSHVLVIFTDNKAGYEQASVAVDSTVHVSKQAFNIALQSDGQEQEVLGKVGRDKPAIKGVPRPPV